jgi:hypothetical protein
MPLDKHVKAAILDLAKVKKTLGHELKMIDFDKQALPS